MKHAALVAASLTPILERDLPDLVIVQGDTSSALGGADAAAAFELAIAHVEAGLRTFDRAMPWPEEGNRVEIDRIADLLFAPTDGAAANLRAEGVRGEIHVTGNTGIDALHATLASLPPPAAPARGRSARAQAKGPLDLVVTCHRRENWGARLNSLAVALVRLAREGTATIEVVLHPNPRIAEVMHLLFANQPGMRLSMPTSHRAMVERMRRADLVLSDSGGVQEEAPTLGVPLLVLRDKTERPEALATGNPRLVGTATATIIEQVRSLAADRAALRRMAEPHSPFGDGHAAHRGAHSRLALCPRPPEACPLARLIDESPWLRHRPPSTRPVRAGPFV